jgi:hypothetical protein
MIAATLRGEARVAAMATSPAVTQAAGFLDSGLSLG